MDNIKPILPGATIGILGSGQLGRMLALAARRMGYRVHVFSPERDTPTGQVADREFSAPYDDLDAVRAFAGSVEVVTYEFENVPAATAAACAEIRPLRPGVKALQIAQNRLHEKRFFAENGLPVTPFASVSDLAELQQALMTIGCPAILKTATAGYDGKGQQLIAQAHEAPDAWTAIGRAPAILEGYVDFAQELSLIAARGVGGQFAAYDLFANTHCRHILDTSQTPAVVPASTAAAAVTYTRVVMEQLDVIGVLCVEFFLTADGRLLLNEIAPRPHNSGHLTIDACVASQFEQQLRAVCGLPLGDAACLRPAAMANLLGDLWQAGEPDWPVVLRLPGIRLHLYGKQEARPGRKMGHLTALADSAAAAARQVRQARQLLRGNSSLEG